MNNTFNYEENYDQEYEKQNIFQRIPKATYIILSIIIIILIIAIKGIFFHTYPNGYDTPEAAMKGFETAWENHDIEGLKRAVLPPELLNPELEYYLVNNYNYKHGYETNFSTLDQIFEYEYYINNNRTEYKLIISSYESHDVNDNYFVDSDKLTTNYYKEYGTKVPINQILKVTLSYGNYNTYRTGYCEFILDKYGNRETDENGYFLVNDYIYIYNVNGKWYIDDRNMVVRIGCNFLPE